MKYIIHGATGAQGSPLFKKLLKAGKAAVAAVRDPAALTDAPAVATDYSSVDSLAAAYRDAEGVFVHLPVVSEEARLQYARNIAEAIGRAKPRRVVISTSGWVVDEPGTSRQSPENSAVSTLIRGVEKSGVSMAVIAPRLYLENLLLPVVLEPAKQEGILRYPLREDYPVSWSSHLDIADVAAELFANTSVTGVVGVGQQPAITGAELADSFSKYFGRKVTYKSLQPEEFGKILTPLFGEGAAASVVGGYQAMAQVSANAINSKTSTQTLLGITPRTVEQWLFEVGV
jgi:uncharacterized protein YbjT (DUF2867 family)